METETSQNIWPALSRNERRVIGTLVEKAKTTPQQYPLSLNALVNGCNQKSNRAPAMELDEEHVDTALERLRELKACVEINADSRTPRYRHTMYEWLGIDKVALAVLTELLLRGEQTIGELRGRAARMDPIEDVAALRPVLDSLLEQGLIQYLTPPGRGCLVTHTLYEPREIDKLREKYGTPPGGYASGSRGGGRPDEDVDAPPPRATPTAESGPAPTVPTKAEQPPPSFAAPDAAGAPDAAAWETLHAEVSGLRAELAEVRAEFEKQLSDLQAELDDLKQQLGVG